MSICYNKACIANDNKPYKANDNTFLDRTIRKYGKEKALLAIYFTTDCMSEYKKNRNLQERKICSLPNDIVSDYTSEEKRVKYCLLVKDSSKILKWCLIDKNLNKVNINNESDGYFEKVLYTMKQGKGFFDPFLKNSSQYYGSLDFEESCTLYFNIVLFLTNASEKENNEFFKEYFDTYTKREEISKPPADNVY